MKNRSKTPSLSMSSIKSKSTISKKINQKTYFLSEYLLSNIKSFQYLKDKNYKLAKFSFEKSVDLAKSINELKYTESLINYGSTLYICGDFENSYINFRKAKELSENLYLISDCVSQIYFIYLRVLSNLSLITLSLNNIDESKEYFNECILLIKSPQIKDIMIQISMLKELVYIFFRIDSLSKYYEVNKQSMYNNIDLNVKNDFRPSFDTELIIDSDSLINLHRSIKEKNITYWIEYLNKEIIKNKNNVNDTSGMLFLIINQIAALYCSKSYEDNNNIGFFVNYLLNYYKQNYGKNLGIKDQELKKVMNDYKIRFDTIVEYYDILINLEEEIKSEFLSYKKNNQISDGNENKILIKLLFSHALKILSKKQYAKNYANNNIKKQIEFALKLIETNMINWKLISIINIDNDIIKSFKILFSNLSKIKSKYNLRKYFTKYKYKTLGYFNYKEKMIKRYIKSKKYLKKKFEYLDDGSILLKLNYGSNGFIEHYYKISCIKDEYYLLVFKTVKEIKPYKVFLLENLNNITIGFKSDNLISKINPKVLKDSKPWLFLSFWFPERTIDIYFDNDEEINKWFEGFYYYCTRIDKNKRKISLCKYFFEKLKLKLLYRIKNMPFDLDIIKRLKYYETKNIFEYLSLPFNKTIVLYNKICLLIKSQKKNK